MNIALKQMLGNYVLKSEQDYINALKEIMQSIALLGLWRAKFFENAAFYGGTALRILYQLDRFSEDLDFSLLTPKDSFDISPYNESIKRELQAFGFEVDVITKEKNALTPIESAFIKANTKQQLIVISTPIDLLKQIHHHQQLKIKMEIDTHPPQGFNTQTEYILMPTPFSVRVYQKPDLFAGKIHALLCRPWQIRVKGRDWYDFIWYIQSNIPVHLNHLKMRLIQSGHWLPEDNLLLVDVKNLIFHKINNTDFNEAQKDIKPFIKRQEDIAVWSKEFFIHITDKLLAVV
jgi:predicted nucleotidyltransferase component of viral defense system